MQLQSPVFSGRFNISSSDKGLPEKRRHIFECPKIPSAPSGKKKNARGDPRQVPAPPKLDGIFYESIVLFTAIIISLMGRVFRSMVMSTTKLSMFDRLIGGFLGMIKGVVIVLALILPISFFPNIYQKLTNNSQSAPYLEKALIYIDQNSTSFKLRKKLDNLNINDAKETISQFIKSNNMADKIKDLKEKIPPLEKQFKLENKPLDEHSNEDKTKLKDILKSVDKN